VRDRASEFYGLANIVRVFGVVGVITGDENDARAKLFGFSNLGAGLDPEGLGFVAGGDAACSVGHCGDDSERFATIFLVKLLFDGREEAVEVDVEEGEAIGMRRGRHQQIY